MRRSRRETCRRSRFRSRSSRASARMRTSSSASTRSRSSWRTRSRTTRTRTGRCSPTNGRMRSSPPVSTPARRRTSAHRSGWPSTRRACTTSRRRPARACSGDRCSRRSSLIRHPEYTRARLAQTSERLRERVYPDLCDPHELVVAGPVGRISYEEAAALEYRPARVGERLGPLWATYWFRVVATVPDAWRAARVDLVWQTTAETTLWRDGRSVQGLHGVDHTQRPDATVLDEARGGERVELALE